MQRRPLLLTLASLIAAPLRALASPSRDAIIRGVFSAPADGLPYTAQHAALMRLLRVQWMPVESGAPAIDFEQPLLGGDDTLAIVRRTLDTGDDALAVRRMAEVCRLVPRYVRAIGNLSPGRYDVPAEMREAFDFPESGVGADGTFALRDAHLMLLRAADWREAEGPALQAVLREGDRFWPMPYIDGKRPYGGASFYQIDMARLLKEPYPLDARGHAVTEPAKDARLARLHAETLAALQVFLRHSTAAKPKRQR
ncbi:hypothetical protein [Achromobacter mucicolens]|uniref:hypothetical protein n=1 Tax=Achromobacter mucicolens TaxID=1389922 RepID=UPI0022F3CB11|nr:hypothetical protein [Achromobacter mucicolens]WBX87029.1 hypothetical protein PE062_16405 [Achromobacter mucicolens]